MNIVTACDSKYFKFLPRFIEQVATVLPGCEIKIYDIGMTFPQQQSIAFSGTKFYPWTSFKSKGTYPKGYIPRALHKPSMLLHACRSLKGTIVYMDVDAVPIAPFEVPDCDVAVTMKSRNEMMKYRGTPLDEYLGYLDAGVVMFGPHERRELFCARWILDLCKDENQSDQKSLNRIVSECTDFSTYNCTHNLFIADENIRVRVLNENEYNSSTAHPDAKILHLRVHEHIIDKPTD